MKDRKEIHGEKKKKDTKDEKERKEDRERGMVGRGREAGLLCGPV